MRQNKQEYDAMKSEIAELKSSIEGYKQRCEKYEKYIRGEHIENAFCKYCEHSIQCEITFRSLCELTCQCHDYQRKDISEINN